MDIKQKAKDYLDKLLSEGAKEIRITWDGGNDEGIYNLYVDDKEIYLNWEIRNGAYDLVEYIGDEIGYGSFAGDYHANGEVIYNVEEGAFMGQDDCEALEDFIYEFDKPLVFTILKDLWFDNVVVDLSGYQDDFDLSVRLSIANGPVFQEHLDFESNAVEVITKAIEKHLFDNVDLDNVSDFWFSQEFSRDSLGVDSDGNFLLAITEIEFNKYVGDVKDVFIQL
jgi:hypothetical protein